MRYTLLRLLVFFGSLLFFWLVGLRSPDQQPLLLGLSALTSLALSFFLLRRERDALSDRISERLDRRLEARRTARAVDEDAEDSADPD
jgi:NhaP-type Na+/H+ or K+/H+ antiporter